MLDEMEHPTWLLSGKPGIKNDCGSVQEDRHRLHRERTFAESSAICNEKNQGRILPTLIVLG